MSRLGVRRLLLCLLDSIVFVKGHRRVLFPNSGSMCVTTAVDGSFTLRGDRTKDLSHLLTAEVSQESRERETRTTVVPHTCEKGVKCLRGRRFMPLTRVTSTLPLPF